MARKRRAVYYKVKVKSKGKVHTSVAGTRAKTFKKNLVNLAKRRKAKLISVQRISKKQAVSLATRKKTAYERKHKGEELVPQRKGKSEFMYLGSK